MKLGRLNVEVIDKAAVPVVGASVEVRIDGKPVQLLHCDGHVDEKGYFIHGEHELWANPLTTMSDGRVACCVPPMKYSLRISCAGLETVDGETEAE